MTTGLESTGALAAIEALREGIDAARELGLDVSPAEAVAREATERLGILPDAYVVALVGGTGVGKSTILNALAGEVVSQASSRRPTTGAPVAWVAKSAEEDIRPLLDRVGAGKTRTHANAELERVVVLDLPDVDSIEAGHRAQVEAVLPKLDVVVWVADPEKYADAALHDAFMRAWLPRLDRQIMVLNKADRLDPEARASVTRDLGRLLEWQARGSGVGTPSPQIPVIATSAVDGPAGIAELRAWLANAADAKTVVGRRLVAAARAALAQLAAAAGATSAEVRPLVDQAAQRRALDGAVEEVTRVVDLRGVEAQAVAATRAAARRRGTGPMGLVTSAVYRLSGRQAAAASPGAYLRAWRQRGGLTRATELARLAVVDAMPSVPAALRGTYAAAAEGSQLERTLGDALDRVVSRQPVETPSSHVWPFIGLAQSANTLVLIFAVAWVILWVIARPEVASFELPILGPVPAPMVLLLASLAVGYVLARLVSVHAGFVGRRWARKVSASVNAGLREAVESEAFARLDRVERARQQLGNALHRIAT